MTIPILQKLNIFKKNTFPGKKVLVLEGGGMRGIFLTGVLQAFADRNYFPWKMIIGSSAGALTGCTYIARQIHLARDAFFTKLLSSDFIHLANILKSEKHILDLDWFVDKIINGEEALDRKALKRSCPVIITAADIREYDYPETIYFNSRKEVIDTVLKASSAIPYLYRGFVSYKNYKLLDGGLLDPIPYKKALAMGYREKDIAVVVTRQKGYRKKEESLWVRMLYDSYYRDNQFMYLVKSMHERYKLYNRELDDLEHKHHGIEVIYPPEKFEVDRLTRDVKVLLDGYMQGIEAGKKYLLSKENQ